MHRYRPSRQLVREAITLSRAARRESEIPSGEEGISVDTVILLVATINKMRDRCKAKRHSYDFNGLARRVCRRTPFDDKRTHAYEVVVMRYYSLVSSLQAARRRKGRE